ncbi:MAG: oligosaccharide flippase family protein, partial [Acidobacteria bacterium]|nr:oligosaccharide flippase family protein [Acidobacteriota bacterium]
MMHQSAVILTLGWFLAPLQFLTAVIVARAVGPEGKGALALLTGPTAILVSLVGLGLPSGAAVLYGREPHRRSEVIGTAMAVTGACSLLLLSSYAWGGAWILAGMLSGPGARQPPAALDRAGARRGRAGGAVGRRGRRSHHRERDARLCRSHRGQRTARAGGDVDPDVPLRLGLGGRPRRLSRRSDRRPGRVRLLVVQRAGSSAPARAYRLRCSA